MQKNQLVKKQVSSTEKVVNPVHSETISKMEKDLESIGEKRTALFNSFSRTISLLSDIYTRLLEEFNPKDNYSIDLILDDIETHIHNEKIKLEVVRNGSH